jgi:hypothetical protein
MAPAVLVQRNCRQDALQFRCASENIPVFPDIPHLAVIRAPASGNVGILGNVLTGIFSGSVK